MFGQQPSKHTIWWLPFLLNIYQINCVGFISRCGLVSLPFFQLQVHTFQYTPRALCHDFPNHYSVSQSKDIKTLQRIYLQDKKMELFFLQKATLQHHTTHVFNEFPKKIKLYQLTSKHFDSVILKGSGDVRGSKSFPWAHTKMICGISTNIS